MTVRRWRGYAPAVAQVVTATPATIEIGDTFTLTINNKIVSFIATAATVANVTAGLTSAWNNSTITEFTEVTATDSTTHVTLTANTAGYPFTVTATTSNTTAGAIVVVETTPGSPGSNEVQKITLDGTPTGGTFIISWDGGAGVETTGAIAYNATAADIKLELEDLTTPVFGDFAVTGDAGGSWTITFTGSYVATNVNLMAVDGTLLTGGNDVAISTATEGSGPSNEIIAVFHNGIGGAWDIVINGMSSPTPGPLDYNATAAQVQTYLELYFGSGNVEVYGGYTASSYAVIRADATANGRIPAIMAGYIIKFTGDLSGVHVVSTIVADVSLLSTDPLDIPTGWNTFIQTGGSTSTSEFQFIDLKNNAVDSGDIYLTYTDVNGVKETTPAINWNAQELSGVAAVLNANIAALGNDSGDTVSSAPFGADSSVGGFIAGIHGVGYLLKLGTAEDHTLLEAVWSGTAAVEALALTVRNLSDGGVANVDEIQHVSASATGGTFTLTFEGQTTAPLAYNISAAALKTALELLSNITTITTSGTGTGEDPWIITFTDPGNRNVDEMTGDGSSLTGGAGTVTVEQDSSTATNEVQTITIDAAVTGGDFTLAYEGQETSAIVYNASALTVETALELLSTIGGLTVAGSAGGPYTVTFDVAPLTSTNVGAIIADGSGLVGGSGTQTLTIATTTASTGPKHLDEPLNWSGGVLPVATDTVVFEDGNRDALYGLDAFTGLTLAKWIKEGAYTGKVGLPRKNSNGYIEYRDRSVQAGITSLIVGLGDGAGPSRFNIDLEAIQSNVKIYASGSSPEKGMRAIHITGSNTLNTLLVLNGQVGTSLIYGTSATFATITQRGGNLILGEGTTVNTSLESTDGILQAEEATLDTATIILQ